MSNDDVKCFMFPSHERIISFGSAFNDADALLAARAEYGKIAAALAAIQDNMTGFAEKLDPRDCRLARIGRKPPQMKVNAGRPYNGNCLEERLCLDVVLVDKNSLKHQFAELGIGAKIPGIRIIVEPVQYTERGVPYTAVSLNVKNVKFTKDKFAGIMATPEDVLSHLNDGGISETALDYDCEEPLSSGFYAGHGNTDATVDQVKTSFLNRMGDLARCPQTRNFLGEFKHFYERRFSGSLKVVASNQQPVPDP